MNLKQEQAIAALKRGLTMCRAAGLSGGVYESKMCVWPEEHNPHDGDFWQIIEDHGEVIISPMHLDGGAGN